MIIYHGSYTEVRKPDIKYSRINLDFGRGFYVTPIEEQAKNWSLKFKKKNKNAIVSIYTLDNNAFNDCKVLKFTSYSEEWLDFILNCRRGKDKSDYDIVMGGVANDKVFNTVELFFDGLIDKKEALKRLKYEKPNMQIAFRNQTVIDKYLSVERSFNL